MSANPYLNRVRQSCPFTAMNFNFVGDFAFIERQRGTEPMNEVKPAYCSYILRSAEIIRPGMTGSACDDGRRPEFFNVLPIPTKFHLTIGQGGSETRSSAPPDDGFQEWASLAARHPRIWDRLRA